MTIPAEIRPVPVHESFVLGKCDYFTDIALWPRKARIDPERWLRNFDDVEREHAVHLLNSFMYFSSDLVREMLKGAFQALSTEVVHVDGPYVHASASWQAFRRSVIVTHVTGETPHDTDSGLLFKRLARQELNVPAENILSPENALTLLVTKGPRPVLFVDDFVGSGDQFIASWRRDITLTTGVSLSFDTYSQSRTSDFYYCPILCTSRGYHAILTSCKAVKLRPAHVIGPEYSVLHTASHIWPDHLRPSAAAFIHTASCRAGISMDTYGYKDLGLCLAFEHCVPDATLPLFYHKANGWTPLIRRA